MEVNGHRDEPPAPQHPKIEIVFDAERQVVGLQFSPAEFKTWDFVIAVLDMAKAEAETKKKFAQMQAMQAQAQAQQMQAEAMQRSRFPRR